jgi:hypothetical protein
VLLLAPLILICISSLGAAACWLMGRPVLAPQLAVVAAITLVSTEVSLLVIRMGGKADQGTASQAGLAGMVLLMLSITGLLVVASFMKLLDTAAITQWAPLHFLAALSLVAVAAIRTIRSAPVSDAAANPSPNGK